MGGIHQRVLIPFHLLQTRRRTSHHWPFISSILSDGTDHHPRHPVQPRRYSATPIAAVQIHHSAEHRRNPSPSSPPVQRSPPFNPQCRPYAGRLLRPKHQFVFDNASPSSVLTATVRPPPVPSSSMRRLNLVR
ncbi:hypothetical protein U1Q18_021199 [Sarracenia purpurea var. burkii]